MLSRVLTTVEREKLLEPNDRVLLAVSGGPDSTALLHALARLAPRLGVTLEAAVVDHGLRAAASSEAETVAGACRALGVICELIQVDVPTERQPGESVMTAARRLRLGALEAAALRRACNKIALGHTADDQAETVLFRIVRGTGLRGLSGIPYRRGPYVRPLLDVGRREILAFLARRKTSFFEDPSNRDRRFARSRVRHDWLPFLAAENPRIVEALVGLAGQARASIQTHPGTAWPNEVRVSGRAEKVIARLAARAAGTKWVTLPNAIAEIAYGRVTLRRCSDAQPHESDQGGAVEPIPVRAPGMYRWSGGRAGIEAITLELVVIESPGGPAGAAVAFDRRVLEQGLVLRTLQPGDRMRPRGGVGSRKLQDLLVDAKIPRGERRALPVLAAGEGAGPILFVPGLRPSEEGRPRLDDRSWLEIRVAPASP